MIDSRKGALDPLLYGAVKQALSRLRALRATARREGNGSSEFRSLCDEVGHWLYAADNYVERKPVRLPNALEGRPTPEATSRDHLEELFKASIALVPAVEELHQEWLRANGGPGQPLRLTSRIDAMKAEREQFIPDAKRHMQRVNEMREQGHADIFIAQKLGIHAKAVGLVPRPVKKKFVPTEKKPYNKVGKGVGAAAYRGGKS